MTFLERTTRLNSATPIVLGLTTATAMFLATASQAQTLEKRYPVIGGYVSASIESVNTHWIEGEHGVIVIDTQRHLDRAREALEAVRKIGKPVVAIFATHPHPDHIAGLGLFKEAYPEAEIYASRLTINEMRADSKKWIGFTRQAYGDGFPKTLTFPTRELANKETLQIDGVKIEVSELGPSEASAATVLYLPQKRALFVGDLVFNQMVPFLLEEGTTAWLKQLDSLSTAYPEARLVYPGHGFPGGAKALLDEQASYLKAMRGFARQELRANADPKTGLTAAASRRAAQAMKVAYPHYEYAAAVPQIDELNVQAVAKELTRQGAK